MQLPITIGLHRSSFGLGGLLATHGVAAAVVLVTPWALWLQGAAIVGLTASALVSWWFWRPRVVGLRLLGDGLIECRLAGREEFLRAELLPEATVHPWLTVIRLRHAEGSAVVVVLPDSTSGEQFRRLRVWLRWRADFSAGKAPA